MNFPVSQLTGMDVWKDLQMLFEGVILLYIFCVCVKEKGVGAFSIKNLK